MDGRSTPALARIVQRHWPFILLILTVLATYTSIWSNGFIYITDDETNIIRFHYDIAKVWSETYEQMYIPVTYTVWTALAYLSETLFGGLRAELYHGVSLLVHIVNTFLVYRLASRFYTLTPVLAAALFALHPLQVETVAWATELRGLLGTMFLLSAFTAFVDRCWSSVGFFLLAVLCKNSMVLATPVFGLAVFLHGVSPLWATLVAQGVVTSLLLIGLQSDPVVVDAMPLSTLGHYATKMVLPINLSVDYGHVLHTSSPVIGILWVAWACLNRHFHLLAIAALLPVLGFIGFRYLNWSYAADRFMYVPLIFVALSFAQGFRWYKIVLLLPLIFFSYNQVGVWKDETTLYGHRVNMDKPVSLIVLGHAALRSGDPAMAGRYYRASVQATERWGVRNEKAKIYLERLAKK